MPIEPAIKFDFLDIFPGFSLKSFAGSDGFCMENQAMPTVIDSPGTQLQKIINLTKSLPVPPKLLIEVITLTDDESAPVMDLVEIIKLEPAIAVEVLRLANSARYGRSRTIKSIKEAVITLGFHEINQMASTLATRALFKQSNIPLQHRKILWHHSVAVAIVANALAKTYACCEPDLAYITGLMHDVGKLLLFEHFTSEYLGIIENESLDLNSAVQQEEIHFGFGHALLGSVLLEEWQLPEVCSVAIAAHHDDYSTESLSGLITIANVFVSSLGYDFHQPAPAFIKRLDNLHFHKESENYEALLELLHKQLEQYQ